MQQLSIVLKVSNGKLRCPWESPHRFRVSVTGGKSPHFTLYFQRVHGVILCLRLTVGLTTLSVTFSFLRIRPAQLLQFLFYFECRSFLADKKYSAQKMKPIPTDGFTTVRMPLIIDLRCRPYTKAIEQVAS